MTTTTQATIPPASTETYAKAQSALAAIAERLRTAAATTSVDTLLADVREARRLHGILRDRLEQVRSEIEAEVTATEAIPA